MRKKVRSLVKRLCGRLDLFEFFYKKLVIHEKQNLIRAVKALEKVDQKKRESSKILRYYLKETGGGDPLTPEEKDQLKEVWGQLWDDGIIRPEWYEIYKKKTGVFDPHFIGHDIHYYYTEWQTIDFDYIPALCDKNYLGMVFPDIRQPKCIARKIRWNYLDENFRPIDLNTAVERVYAAREREAVVKISRSSFGGAGVTFVGRDTTREEIRKLLISGRDIHVQEALRQHPRMAALNESSVNSVRVMTVMMGGKVLPLSSVVRVGGSGSRVDNFSMGGVACGVGKDGTLRGVGYTKDGTAVETAENGLVFKGYEIPNYQKVLDTVVGMHYRVPAFGVISWDIAIDEAGEPVLIEYNVGKGGILTHQYCNGPLYGEHFDTIVQRVFRDYRCETKRTGLHYQYSILNDRTNILKGGRAGLRNLVIPREIENKPVRSIGSEAYKETFSLKKVVIRANLERIGYMAFVRCEALRTVRFEGTVERLDRSAFNGCSSLREVVLPEGLKTIGMWTFKGCTALRTIRIPESVEKIAEDAFENVPNLTILCPAGSYAETWAKEHGIHVVNK